MAAFLPETQSSPLARGCITCKSIPGVFIRYSSTDASGRRSWRCLRNFVPLENLLVAESVVLLKSLGAEFCRFLALILCSKLFQQRQLLPLELRVIMSIGSIYFHIMCQGHEQCLWRQQVMDLGLKGKTGH